TEQIAIEQRHHGVCIYRVRLYDSRWPARPPEPHDCLSDSLVLQYAHFMGQRPTLGALCRAPSTKVSSAAIIRLRSLSVFLGYSGWRRLATVAPRLGRCYGTRKAQYGHETVAR